MKTQNNSNAAHVANNVKKEWVIPQMQTISLNISAPSSGNDNFFEQEPFS